MTFRRSVILPWESGPRNRRCPISGTWSRSARMRCNATPPACLDPPRTPARNLPQDQALARGAVPAKHDFGGGLVAIFIQFLESFCSARSFTARFSGPSRSILIGRRAKDGTPPPPRGASILASMCRYLWWKHFCTPYKLEFGRDSSRWNFHVVTRRRGDFAPCSMLLGRPGRVDLVAKMDACGEGAARPRSLTDFLSMIKMQSAAIFADESFVRLLLQR